MTPPRRSQAPRALVSPPRIQRISCLARSPHSRQIRHSRHQIFAYNPTNDVELSEAAGFEPVQKVTARVDQPRRTLSRRSLSWPVFPIPWLLRLRRHSLRSPVFCRYSRSYAARGSRSRERSGRRGRKPRQCAQQPRLYVGVCAHRSAGQPQEDGQAGRCRARHPHGARHQNLPGTAQQARARRHQHRDLSWRVCLPGRSLRLG